MIHEQLRMRNRARHERSRTEAIDLLKDAFVCVTIPVVAFALAYIALDTFARLFFG